MKFILASSLILYPLLVTSEYLKSSPELRNTAMKLVLKESTLQNASPLVNKAIADLKNIAGGNPIDPASFVWTIDQLYFALSSAPKTDEFKMLKATTDELVSIAGLKSTDIGNGVTTVSFTPSGGATTGNTGTDGESSVANTGNKNDGSSTGIANNGEKSQNDRSSVAGTNAGDANVRNGENQSPPANGAETGTRTGAVNPNEPNQTGSASSASGSPAATQNSSNSSDQKSASASSSPTSSIIPGLPSQPNSNDGYKIKSIGMIVSVLTLIMTVL